MPTKQANAISRKRKYAAIDLLISDNFLSDNVAYRSVLFSKEFSKNVPGASVFEELVVHIHKRCLERKYFIRIYPSDEKRSSVEWIRNGNDSFGVIQIDPRASSGSYPLDAFWDLVHEWGHTVDEPPPVGYKPCKNELTYAREFSAWKAGWEGACELLPAIQKQELDFLRRQEDCLSSYRS